MDNHSGNTFQFFLIMIGAVHALTFQQWISFFIVLTGVGHLLVNLYYKKKYLRLKAMDLELRRQAIKKEFKIEDEKEDS